VLNPSGQVVVSVYCSGVIGRLVPEDVIGLIGYLRAHCELNRRCPWAAQLGGPGTAAFRRLARG
jgi:hypothetical protein